VIIASSEIHTITPGADVGGGGNVANNYRFGHALANVAFTGNGVLSKAPPPADVLAKSGTRKMGCGGGGGGGRTIKDKMLEITKELRKTLGLEDIISYDEVKEEDWVHIMPVAIPEPESLPPFDSIHAEPIDLPSLPSVQDTTTYPIFVEPTFLERINASLMALGPWEARAVAFVFGV
jgi:hypothetical protein